MTDESNLENFFDTEEMFRWIETQTSFGPRRPGSPAGRANEDFIFSLLQDFGLTNLRREPIPVTGWVCKSASLSVGNKEFPVFGIPFTKFTGQSGSDASLVFAEPGRIWAPGDWRGRIVVTPIRFPMLDARKLRRLALGEYDPAGDLEASDHAATWIRLGWHVYKWAAKRGAAGFVGILVDQPGGSCEMYAPYGFKEKNILDKPIPGMWARREDAEELTSLARARASARLLLTGAQEPAMSHNIVAEIPGMSDEVLVLSTHHDSPFTSPVEDGSGVAVVLALARYLTQAAKKRIPRRRTVVVFSSGHFYGSIGTRSFITQHKSDIVARAALEISIEHIALEAKEDVRGKLIPTGRPEPIGIFVPFSRKVRDALRECLSKSGLERVLLLPSEGPLGEYPPTDGGDWYEAGVPVINYICNPVYLLTNDDAIHWVDKNRLAKVATMFANLISQLDGMEKSDFHRIDFPLRRLLMRFLRRLVKARTTVFGLKPIH